MANYVMLSNITDSGAEALARNPGRLQDINKEVERAGGKILAQYAVLGPYDFVTVVEAKGNLEVMEISRIMSGSGTLHITTLAAVPIDQLLAKSISSATRHG